MQAVGVGRQAAVHPCRLTLQSISGDAPNKSKEKQMKRFLLAALIGLLIGALAFAAGTDVKGQIGTQDLNLDTDGAVHGTFQRRTSTGGSITLDKFDGNRLPWSLDYTRSIRPLNILGNDCGSISGYKDLTGPGPGSITGFNIPLYLTEYLSVYDAITAWEDVRKHGAVGDNTADDTTKIQAAHEAAPYGIV